MIDLSSTAEEICFYLHKMLDSAFVLALLSQLCYFKQYIVHYTVDKC